MSKPKEDIRKILNLRSHKGIALSVSDRQLAVIKKAYEYLSQDKNDIIYIADEVGLGKTYIGLGIAALLRHHKRFPDKHTDLMIVPKKNLQDKWQKELRNFGARNYPGAGEYFGPATWEDGIIADRLRPLYQGRLFTILRMTSFSSLISSRTGLRHYFRYQVFQGDPFCLEMINRADDLGYFNNGGRGMLLRLVACMLNAQSAKVDCLIIDEAHNYKYGPGEDGEGTARNQVTSRFLGAVRDDEIRKVFPEVYNKMHFPLAKKIICLSATPKDRNLLEIREQFNCFINRHLLKNCETVTDVKNMLPYFLIRGNMEYKLAGERYSRNQCRHEHRKGNVALLPKAEPIALGDDFDNVFWQLLQYQSIKYLSQKANASFEIGMLAGFESYELDMDKRVAAATDDDGQHNDKEYENTRTRSKKFSEDANVIRSLIGSYKDAFNNDPPPHPKLSRLESALAGLFGTQEKALVFVRRIATVDELLRHLMQRYDVDLVHHQYLQLTGKWAGYLTDKVKEMKKACLSFYIDPKRIGALSAVCELPALVKWAKTITMSPDAGLDGLLDFCFQRETASLLALLDEYLIKEKFRPVLVKAALGDIKAAYPLWLEQSIEQDDTIVADEDDETQLRADSFFKNYFKRGRNGYRFRAKIYRENWFNFNYYLLLNSDEDWNADAASGRKRAGEYLLQSEGRRAYLHFNDFQSAFKTALEQNEEIVKPRPLPRDKNPLTERTFLTDLITTCCASEWAAWKQQRKGLNWTEIFKDMAALNALLQSVFLHSSGLLPAFLADSRTGDFKRHLINLLQADDAPFHFVLTEVKTIIADYDLIIAVNFQEREAKKISDTLKNRSPVVGASGQDKNRSAIAARFRMPGFPYALIATDIFHEGEDLHTYCQNVYHYGIAWNPSGIEQRTGRIDRINSLSYRKLSNADALLFEDKVQVFYPYLSRSVEVNQVVKLLGYINQFLEDFNKIDSDQTYNSEVSVNEAVTADGIPPAITHRINSIYDVEHFKGV